MVRMRVAEEDCNAGVIFENLTSEHWKDEKTAIDFISEAIPVQNLQLLVFNFLSNQDSEAEHPIRKQLDAFD